MVWAKSMGLHKHLLFALTGLVRQHTFGLPDAEEWHVLFSAIMIGKALPVNIETSPGHIPFLTAALVTAKCHTKSQTLLIKRSTCLKFQSLALISLASKSGSTVHMRVGRPEAGGQGRPHCSAPSPGMQTHHPQTLIAT